MKNKNSQRNDRNIGRVLYFYDNAMIEQKTDHGLNTWGLENNFIKN